MYTLIHLRGIADKSYTDQPEYIGVAMAFVLYPEYSMTTNF